MTAILPPRDAHAPWPPSIPRMCREAHQRFVAESRAFAWRQRVPAYANTAQKIARYDFGGPVDTASARDACVDAGSRSALRSAGSLSHPQEFPDANA